jgi:hypothetical protein
MRCNRIGAAMLSALSLLFAGSAFSDDGIDVKITNDGTQDIVVTVYDLNTNPRRAVLSNARINGFTSIPISLVADANGKARISWTATSTDADFRKCGHAQAVVGDADTVNVHADSSCGGTS